MYQNPVIDHDGEVLAEFGLRGLTQQETSLVGAGLKIAGGSGSSGGNGGFGGCPLPNDHRLGPFCTN